LMHRRQHDAVAQRDLADLQRREQQGLSHETSPLLRAARRQGPDNGPSLA
jgi:hypothetical protein